MLLAHIERRETGSQIESNKGILSIYTSNSEILHAVYIFYHFRMPTNSGQESFIVSARSMGHIWHPVD